MTKFKFLVVVMAALPVAAQAVCPVRVEDAPILVRVIKDAGGGVVDAVQTLRQQDKTLSDKEMKNMKEIADAAEQARITNNGLFQVTKNPCQTASLARTFERLGGNTGGARIPGAGSPAAMRRIADQNALTGTRSPSQDLGLSLNSHQAEYCSEADAGSLGCKPSSERDPVDGLAKQDADTSITSLIGVPAYTPERAKWASDYIANVNRMVPTPGFTDAQKTAFGSATGQAYLSLKNAERAALSVGQNSFGQAYDLRRPMPGATLAMLEDLAPEYAARRPAGLPANPSTMEFIEGGVDHYFSRKWMTDMSASSGSPIEKERLRQNALLLKLQALQFQQRERIELLLAQNVIGKVQQTMQPHLAAQRRAALAEAGK